MITYVITNKKRLVPGDTNKILYVVQISKTLSKDTKNSERIIDQIVNSYLEIKNNLDFERDCHEAKYESIFKRPDNPRPKDHDDTEKDYMKDVYEPFLVKLEEYEKARNAWNSRFTSSLVLPNLKESLVIARFILLENFEVI